MTVIAYCGNFTPPHSTENHCKKAFENLGHTVWPIQESGLDWTTLPDLVAGSDVFWWTRTAGYDPPDLEAQARAIKSLNVPTVGGHLDRWVGLHREPDVHRSPFFRLDWLFTADGGHPEFWAEHGINHHWSPPGILSDECDLGTFRQEYAVDVGFVGNLRNYGHKEWTMYRRHLYRFLTRRYRFKVWEGGIRGRDLADLYQSVKVLVGDSCLAGSGPLLPQQVRGGTTRYFSDRIPETLGRGGFLIHPRVEGVTDALFVEGEHLACYELGDFAELGEKIDYYLANEAERLRIARQGREWMMANHTYEHRLTRILDTALG